MTPEQYQRAKRLFAEASALTGNARSEFIDRATGDDDELRQLVETLLAADSNPQAFVDSELVGGGARVLAADIASQQQDEPRTADSIPKRIGRYTILRRIAEGGMGVVYEARQEHPERAVALKVVRPGMATRSALRRFRFETEVLGQLKHAGIARIYEASTADLAGSEQPFFAMEFIHGRPLLEYAHRSNLSARARLELFAKVCDAVHYAHQKGVIHRDLKPANILVDESEGAVGQPKVLDFGVARVTDADMQTVTMQTDIGQLIGTVPYMSPEQVSGDSRELDTRSDVYSLGVILYELLSGRLPHDVRKASIPEATRRIRDEEPLRLALVNRAFRGEIETIVAKALEKAKTRRYQSASNLATDIRRYLRDEPIEAKRDSALYVLRKSLWRHRAATASATVILVLLVAFAVVSSIQAVRNRRLAEKADATSARLQRELTVSNIERGRLFGQTGHLVAAERLIWREHLLHPDSKYTFWALWELYSRNPSLAAVATRSTLRTVAYSPDGRTIATGDNDAVVTLWKAATVQRVASLREHTDIVRGLAFSPDGRSLASASMDGTVVVWDLTSNEAVQTLRGHTGGACAVCYAPDGKQLVSGAADGTMRIWNTATADCISTHQEHAGPIWCLRFSPDGSLLASGSNDQTIRLWRDLASPPVATLLGHTRYVGALAFSRDGRTLASGSADKFIKLWDLSTYECLDTIPAANGSVRLLWFATNDKALIVGGWWRIDAWDLDTRTRTQLQAHGVADCSPGADVSPDGRFVATYFECLRIADIGTDAGLLRLGGGAVRGAATVSPDGRVIVSGDALGRTLLWETTTGRLLAALPPHTANLSSGHFDPSGELLAACYLDGCVKLWNLTTGGLINSLDGHHTATGHSLCFSPDGRAMASTQPDGTILIRDVPTCRVAATIPPAPTELLSVCFSPDGDTIAATHREGIIRLYSAEYKLRAELRTDGTPWTVAFSPNGEELAAACWWTGPIQVWDLATNTRDLRLDEPKAAVWEVAYMPGDPDVLASASSDGTVRLWDLREQRNILTLDPFDGFDATSVSFAAGGTALIATGRDGSLCVWDLQYYERHMAGNLLYQLALLRPELSETVRADHLIAWAQEVQSRPWPRIGPHAKQTANSPDAAAAFPGVTPETIAAWGNRWQH